jgi:hypothetical protein
VLSNGRIRLLPNRYYIFKLIYPRILFLFWERDLYLKIIIAGNMVWTGLRRKADIGASGGQPGSNAMGGRSLDDDRPCGYRTYPGGEARREACRSRVLVGGATRSSGGGPQDRPPLDEPGTAGFGYDLRTPHILSKEGDLIHVFDTPLPHHVGTQTCEECLMAQAVGLP